MSVYKDTEKIYLIAAIESLINRNENNATDLGNYILEYKLKQDYDFSDAEYGYPPLILLTILVRLRNKHTNKLEWANIFEKTLARDRGENKDYVEEVLNHPKSEIMNLILRPETSIFKKLYSKRGIVATDDFFKNFEYSDGEGYPCLSLGGPIPKDVKKEALVTLNRLLDNTKQYIDYSKKRR